MPILDQLGKNIFGGKPGPDDTAIAMPDETIHERAETDAALRAIAPVAMPADLQLRLRLAVSHERVRAGRQWSGRIAHRWHLVRENTLSRVAVQGALMATAALLLLGAGASLIAVAPQQAVEANDVPLVGFSAPKYLYSSSGLMQPIGSADQVPLTIEAKINSTGRIYDYRVLSGTLSPASDVVLRERMLSSVFRPAKFFGEPVQGTVVLTFADVDVHG